MIGLPQDGERVRIWPFPNKSIQDGPRPVDALGGGRWLGTGEENEGREVVWGPFYLEQLRAGDILLHPYTPPVSKEKPAAAEAYDPGKAAAKHMAALRPKEEAKPEKPEPTKTDSKKGKE